MGWFVLIGAVAGLVGCFIPFSNGTSGFDASLVGQASGAYAMWLYPGGLVLALILGFVTALSSGSKAGWFALAGVGGGLAATFTLQGLITASQMGAMSQVGLGFWLIFLGSLDAVLCSVIGAFMEGR